MKKKESFKQNFHNREVFLRMEWKSSQLSRKQQKWLLKFGLKREPAVVNEKPQNSIESARIFFQFENSKIKVSLFWWGMEEAILIEWQLPKEKEEEDKGAGE